MADNLQGRITIEYETRLRKNVRDSSYLVNRIKERGAGLFPFNDQINSDKKNRRRSVIHDEKSVDLCSAKEFEKRNCIMF